MAPRCVAGLEAVLESTGLQAHVQAAAEWCERMGPRDIDEIAEDDVFEEFVEALQLKPLERRRLKKALLGGSGIGGGGCQQALEAPSEPSSSAGPVPLPQGPTVFVKNTFLDLDEGPRTAIRRLQTEPAQVPDALASLEELLASGDGPDESELTSSATTSVQPEEDEQEELVPATADVVASPDLAPIAGAEALVGLYKTVTCDGYEPVGEWAWADGDPNKPAAVPEDEAVYHEAPGEMAMAAAPAAGGPLDPLAQGHHMVGMVMVPAEAAAGFGLPLAASGLCFPGCVAMPMDRFARWPGDMQAFGADGLSAAAAAAGALAGGAAGSMGALQVAAAPAASGCSAVTLAAPAATVAVADSSENSDEGPKRAQVLQRAFSVASSIYRIRWTVDARKLVSTDREHVSPAFELSFAGPVKFKMIMRPKVISDEKGGASFKKARGRGKILLRCLEDVDSAVTKPVVTFRLAVGSGDPAKQAAPRGPVRHDFSERPICGLPESQQQWDFTKAVDKTTHTFVVCLEVLSGPAGS